MDFGIHQWSDCWLTCPCENLAAVTRFSRRGRLGGRGGCGGLTVYQNNKMCILEMVNEVALEVHTL